MRWLMAAPGPGFSVYDVYAGWVEGLRANGQTVIEYPMGDLITFYDAVHIEREGEYVKALSGQEAKKLAADRLAAALYKVAPDVLLSVSSFFLTPEILDLARKRGTKVVLLHTESPYEDDRQIALAPFADLNLLNDPTNLEAFEEQAPTIYAPHAYRERMHYRDDTKRLTDFSFVGTGYPSRVEFFEQFDLSDLDVKLAGNWMRLPEWHSLRKHVVHDINECFDNEDAAPLYRSTKVGLNLYRREANRADLLAGWAMGPREVEMAACGLFFLRDPRPESDELFPMLPTFRGGEEASDLLRYWLAHDSEREKRAAQAAEVVSDRTFTQHAAKLLRLFG